jgi:hypothetical protein
VLIKNRNALVLSRMVDTSFVASRRIQCASSVRRGGSKLEDAERVQSSRLALIDYMCDVRCAMCDVRCAMCKEFLEAMSHILLILSVHALETKGIFGVSNRCLIWALGMGGVVGRFGSIH